MPKAHALVDNFNDNSTDPLLWTAYGNPAPFIDRVREINGRVEMRPRSTATSTFSGYATSILSDLTSSSVHVEMIQALRPAVGATTSFSVEMNSTNSLYFAVENGDLRCELQVAAVFTLLKQVPYDPAAHRWLRLREEAGTTFWEVSPDGAQWSALVSRPNPFNLVSVTLRLQVGMSQAVPSPGAAIFDNFNVIETSRSRRMEERRRSARDIRGEAAALADARPHPEHVNNDDEVNYSGNPYVGNYSKRFRHDSLGDPEPYSYGTLLRALQSEDPDDFERLQLFTTNAFDLVKLTNPQAGLAFESGGPDAQEITMPPAPRFDSEQTAHEMAELYWMALARDVPFIDWQAQVSIPGSVIREAVRSLLNEFPGYGGPQVNSTQDLFRGIYPGERVGPYVSQFLLKGNVDQRKPVGQGRDATDGFISYGAQTIDQRITPAQTGLDYLTTFSTWLDVQNGRDTRGQDSFQSTRRFISTLRDGATYVHFDQVLNAFYNAAWILMSEPDGNQLSFVSGTTKRPQIDPEFPKDQGNPYEPPGGALDSKTQSGFATFGPIQVLEVLGEVLGRSLRAVWWQKWGVHRRLRPEEYGGRVHNQATNVRTYTLDTSIVTSLRSGLLAPFYGNPGETFPSSFLLPQAYPEGAPTHPAYGAGHATGSAACATILKAFFDESKSIENPVQANASGSLLVSYTGPDATQMTVGGELNKLAGNIALFRNAAGVHWRSDYTESFPLGEAIAIRLLQEMSLGFNEDDAFFELTRFDGQKIRIFDGKVVPIE